MRISNKKTIGFADAILTADWHLRDTQPKCRTDNYYQVQFNKIRFIKGLANMHEGCPVLIAGDIFDTAKPSPMLLASTLHFLPSLVVCIPGQHDMPSHSLENLNQSGLAVIEQGSDCTVLKNPTDYKPSIAGNEIIGFPWGSKISNIKGDIALVHTLLQEPKNYNSHIAYEEDCESLLKKLPACRLVVSGDNHKSFTYRKGEQLIVNPGSIMRMDADQIDYKPCVYLWYAGTNTVEPVYLPIGEDVVTREHLEKKQEEDLRMEAYKNRLQACVEIGVSFEKNIDNYIRKNKIEKEISQEIYTAMGVK